jgi:anti-sigma regulatory factor (Ser/Thr protein kinase)
VSLPADRRAPAAARAAVREVLEAARLDELMDDALLLATELTTNAVLHVGSDISVLVEASDDSVTVTIRDSEPDELPRLDASVAVEYPLANTGRGLLLVDKIAYRWGTTQDLEGKAVWFQLFKSGAPAALDEPWHSGTAAGFMAWLRRRRLRPHGHMVAGE